MIFFINLEVNHVAFQMKGCFGSKVCINCWFSDCWIRKPNFYYGLVDLKWFFQLWISESRIFIFELWIGSFRMIFFFYSSFIKRDNPYIIISITHQSTTFSYFFSNIVLRIGFHCSVPSPGFSSLCCTMWLLLRSLINGNVSGLIEEIMNQNTCKQSGEGLCNFFPLNHNMFVLVMDIEWVPF